ncbi:MAG: ribokinase [Verrucomicrobiota bacterium]
MPKSKSSIVTVVGSLNIDYLSSVSHLPAPGDTVAASQLQILFGGKGANQAIAAARQGAHVHFIGSVGDDDRGSSYLSYLDKEGIDTQAVSQRKNSHTGSAMIAVDQNGENMIIVAAGANGETCAEDIQKFAALIKQADLLVLQLELPLDAVVSAMQIANQAQTPVIFNPSPINEEFPWGELSIQYLIVNEGEAEAILGTHIDASCKPDDVAALLKSKNIDQLIITRGSKSTLFFSPTERIEIAAFPVTPVDTVGAGDAFCGTFAARLAEKPETAMADLIKIANAAGALTTLAHGAQDPIPDKKTTDQQLKKQLQ